jgi:hypothetical protein
MLQRHQLYELSYSVDTKLVGETPQLLTVNAKTSTQGALVHNDTITIVFDSPNIFNSGTTPSVQLASPVDGDCTGLTSTATSSTEDYTVTVVVTLGNSCNIADNTTFTLTFSSEIMVNSGPRRIRFKMKSNVDSTFTEMVSGLITEYPRLSMTSVITNNNILVLSQRKLFLMGKRLL